MPKKFDPAIKAMVEMLGVDSTVSAADIRHHLERTAEKERLPSKRTIATWIQAVRATDTSGTWQMGRDKSEEPEDTAAILETLRAVIRRTLGEVSRLTIAEAEWVVRLRRSANLPPWAAFVYARRYMAAGGLSEELDLEVATWGDEQALRLAAGKRRLSGERTERSAKLLRIFAMVDEVTWARLINAGLTVDEEGRLAISEGGDSAET